MVPPLKPGYVVSMHTGNCKGIMLCQRPSLQPDVITQDVTTKVLGDGTLPHIGSTPHSNESFICGTAKKPWGSNVVINEKERVLKRINMKENALYKHRAWLKQMQQKRERSEKERVDSAQARDNRKRAFMSTQAANRARVLNRTVTYEESAPANSGAHRGPSCRNAPPWAMPETVAQEFADAMEAKEEEDLLHFADSLDFEQYSHDMELCMLMKRVRERIQTMEREESLAGDVWPQVTRAAAAQDEVSNFTICVGVEDAGSNIHVSRDHLEEKAITSVAENVRSEGSISSIHSQQSMQVLVAKSRQRLQRNRLAGEPPLASVAETNQLAEVAVEAPIMVNHIDHEGRLAQRRTLAKLAFKNRNPAI